jgi:hypothetical protein
LCILGGPGVGKTTFLQWFFSIGGPDKLLKNTLVLWADITKIMYSEDEIHKGLMGLLIEQLENSCELKINSQSQLKQVFSDKIKREEIKRLAAYEKDSEEYNKCVSELISNWCADSDMYLNSLLYYAAQHCSHPVVIVIDNVDQKDEKIQLSLYQFSQYLARAHPITVIISMREDTYFKSRQKSFVNAFSQRQIFHIRAPRLSPVLSQRFEYLSKELGSQSFVVTSSAGMKLDVADATAFLDLIRRSIIEGTDSGEICEMIESVSSRNMRNSLNIIYNFLTSGHTKLEKYFWEYAKSTNTSCIPFHEFLSSVMLNDLAYYSESNSEYFINIFTRYPAFRDSHFTRLRILKLIEHLSPNNSYKPEDYISINTIIDQFASAGFDVASTKKHLYTMVENKLLETDVAITEYDDLKKHKLMDCSVHLSSSGYYYLTTLSREYTYIQCILPDVPVTDADVYSCLLGIYNPPRYPDLNINLQSTLEAVTIFLDYLKKQEKEELATLGGIGTLPVTTFKFMPEISANVQARIAHIHQRIKEKSESKKIR